MRDTNSKALLRSISFAGLLFPLCLILLSCGPAMNAPSYIAWVEKNKAQFSRTVKRNGVNVTVCYRPSEYYAAKDMLLDSTLACSAATTRYKNALYFAVGVTMGDRSPGSTMLMRGGSEQYSANVHQNTFSKDEDVFLLKGKDTVNVSTYTFERSWGLGNADLFLFAFDRTQLKDAIGSYDLYCRNLLPETGTIVVPLEKIVKNGRKLKG